jgi:DNA-directed RNA polymerase subunit RPC12/RpoP
MFVKTIQDNQVEYICKKCGTEVKAELPQQESN